MRNDCDCITHTGPHFFHMDILHFRQNTGLLATGTMLGLMGFSREEASRMDRLVLELRSAGCSENELIYKFLERVGYDLDVVNDCRATKDQAEQERLAVWEGLSMR